MPPLKGKGKDARSRVGTPALGDASEQQTGTADSAKSANTKMSYDDILDKYCKSSSPPPSAVLKKIHEALVICRDVAKDRSDRCDKSMRDFSRKRKDLFQVQQQQEIEEARAEEERQAEIRRGEQEAAAKARPPAVGARGLAPQDGSVAAGKSIDFGLSCALWTSMLLFPWRTPMEASREWAAARKPAFRRITLSLSISLHN